MAESTLGYALVREGDAEIARVTLRGGPFVMGRSEAAAIQLNAETVSREHAELFADIAGRWRIRDLDSRNGTFVNGEAITEHALGPGDEIQIDPFTLTLHLAGSAKPCLSTVPFGSEVTITEAGGGRVARLEELETPKVDASHLAMLTDFSGQLLATEDDGQRLEALCRVMVGKTFCGNASLALRIDKTASADTAPQMLCAPVTARNWRSQDEPYISGAMLRAVRAGESPVLASNVAIGADDVVEMSLAASVVEMAAVMCPIYSDAEVLDVLHVALPPEYGTGEWLALTALACGQYQQAEVAWQARRAAQDQAVIQRELQKAERIQRRLIPVDPTVPGLDVAIGFEPCRWVGGDYVDVVTMPDGRIFLTVCDVCGKGMQAALVTASLHAGIHMIVAAGKSIVQIMDPLNDYLCRTLPDDSFVTAIGVILDLGTGQCEGINAGHPPAMIVDPQGRVRYMDFAQNPPLGCVPISFEAHAATLKPGEVLALFTDGYTELPNEDNELLGIEGVDACLAKSVAGDDVQSIADLAERFKQNLTAHQGDASAPDDLTFMLARRV